LAQSIFQIGGNAGTAIGPLLITAIVLTRGQHAISYFALFALAGMIILFFIGKWYKKYLSEHKRQLKKGMAMELFLPKKKVQMSFFILLVLIFSKYFYTASITSYLHLYMIEKFHFSVSQAQSYLFAYLFAVAIGTLIGGPIGDKIGRKYVIWISVMGVAPFTMLLPYANPFWALVLLIIIGVIIASAFPAIIVYAQELLPGRTGMVSGLFYGFAFGMGGIGAASLGELADDYGLIQVFHWCAYLPLLGLLTVYLPNLKKHQKSQE
jgi:FSR family fosmidomycin resistance protein-like MFS transporter